MKTCTNPEDRSWPRENAKDTKTRTTPGRDFEQEAMERRKIQKETSLFPSLTSVQICRPFICVLSSFQSTLCFLRCLVFKPSWPRSFLCALCVLLWQSALADV